MIPGFFSAAAMGSFSPPTWTPADVTTQLWYDANDASTITIAGGEVSEWRDKSGNARHMNGGILGFRPTLIAGGLSGKNTIRFAGTNDSMISNGAPLSGLLQNVNGYLIGIVRKHTTVPTVARTIIVISVSGSGNARAVVEGGRTSGKTGAGGRRLDAGSFQSVPSTTNIGSGFDVVTVHVDFSSTLCQIYLNGLLDASEASFQSSGLTSNTTPNRVVLGANGGQNADWFAGDIAEIVVMNGVQTSLVRQDMEDYLAYKWGL